ncbi:MAG: phosphotransferase [Nitrospina sp.]|jgi:protein-ribulosamine 3-kinase|nr:phosphotransferase [Nitrospina sp.]MBT3413556.1 phosphotransferase [Nitrospina sp.]MBT3855520.1 phosphotransferase [Nitrospina sp.]MBT4104894.1 phosphotransferase [Nitrospina sp.]MBT4388649.1 phosphotransferase [Nitrospina sp.]
MNEEISRLLEPVFGREVKVQSSASTSGGCINQTSVLRLTNDERVFLKYNSHPPANFFNVEARGLKLLAQTAKGPRIPKPLALQDCAKPTFLILEYIEESSPGQDFSVRFARSLAELHQTSHDSFGLDHDNYIGSTVQKNAQETNGIDFFRDQRLRPQQELARKTLPPSTDKNLSKLYDRLENYLDISGEKPALLHGDLWSGNYFPDKDQVPCIFDPAVYFGLREADLAMTELFGRLPQKFYDAYHEAFPLNPGYEERKDLYNLYHLLNHLNLFGGSYLASVEQVVRRYVK